ncbi:hypothetical protein [Ruminococcus sp.]|uniref:hypothetical protein n=1 Tax=Ruminococcus sp. TaxID=41978 RepID=UPI00258A69BB|nr:hypothetical protein [Ruminococcus sp.]MCR5020095.1 hypothetical protein [Ruminococcus sp.]
MTKRIIAAVLALTTVLAAGCSKNGSDSAKDTIAQLSKGRYVEEDVKTGNIGMVSEFANGDKKQIADLSYDGSTDQLHYLENGKFLSEKLNGFKGIGDHNTPSDLATSPNGDIFISCFNEEAAEGEPMFRYGILTSDGETKEVKIDDDIMLMSFEYSKDGTLYLTDGMSLYRLENDSLEITKLCELDNFYSRLDIVDDLIYFTEPDPENDSIAIYDITAGKLTDPDEALSEFWSKKSSDDWNDGYDIFGVTDGALYIACPKGIYRHMNDGSMVEQLLDSMTNSLSDSKDKIAYGTTDIDGSFIISFQNANIKRYYYDPEAVNEFTSELNIYSLHESVALTQAIRAYSRQHSEVRINCEYGMHDGVTYEDAMKELTTKIMSDNAPDIIMLDGMDIDSMEQKGMLEDISQIREQWEPDNKLMTNLTEWNNKGGLYSVASRFGAVARAGKKDNFDSLNSLNSVFEHTLKAESEGKLAHSDTPMDDEQISERVRKDIILTADTLFKDGKPDKQAIQDYYKYAQKVYSSRQLMVGEESKWDVAYLGIGLESDTLGTFYNVLDIKTLCSVNDGRDNIKFDFGTNSAKISFVPVCDLGICSAGNNKDNAAGFIKTALSSEVQSMDCEVGLPVDGNELEKLIKNDETIGSLGLTNSDGSYIDYMLNSPQTEELSALISYAESADTPLSADEQTVNILTESAMSCINNSLTPAEAAKQAMSKLELRTKE